MILHRLKMLPEFCRLPYVRVTDEVIVKFDRKKARVTLISKTKSDLVGFVELFTLFVHFLATHLGFSDAAAPGFYKSTNLSEVKIEINS